MQLTIKTKLFTQTTSAVVTDGRTYLQQSATDNDILRRHIVYKRRPLVYAGRNTQVHQLHEWMDKMCSLD